MSVTVKHGVSLPDYVARQLQSLFPVDLIEKDRAVIEQALERALIRMSAILRKVRAFEDNAFDSFNSLQYASFLYILGNEIWRNFGPVPLVDRLFYLNKSLNSVDIYPAIDLPGVFFMSHGTGAVLGNARYGHDIVVFQNVTVGRVGNNRPILGDGIVLYPGASVTGRSVVGSNCVVGAGVTLHNRTIPDGSLVVVEDGKTVIRALEKDFLGLYLHP